MMKRMICILLILSLLLCACSSGEREEKTERFSFYFSPENPYGGTEFLTLEATFGEEIPPLEELIPLYFSTEVPEGAKPLLPKGWKLSTYDLQTGGQLVMTFVGTEAAYIEESRTLACLTRTFAQLEDVHRVKLCPPGEREPLVLSVNGLLMEDMGMFPREEVVLYFPDEDLRYLQRETFMVDSFAEGDRASYIVNRLLEGSETGEVRSCIPTGTKLLDIRVENGVCTVDLSSEFARNMPKQFRIAHLAVYSIVNSLTELEEISTVDIRISHSAEERLGSLDLSKGLQRDESLLAGNSGYDGSLYPYDMDSDLLVEIPIWIREDPNKSTEELLLAALLEYHSEHFVCHSIPKGTSILSVRMAENTCVVDLTAEFTDRSANVRAQRLAVYSIVATLISLPYVDAVEILVEGNRPQYLTHILREIRTAEPDWFAEGEW